MRNIKQESCECQFWKFLGTFWQVFGPRSNENTRWMLFLTTTPSRRYVIYRKSISLSILAIEIFKLLLACLHDQSKSGFFGGPAFFQPIRGFLKTFQIALIGWINAGPPKKPLLFWSCIQAISGSLKLKMLLLLFVFHNWLCFVTQLLLFLNSSFCFYV